MQSDAGGGARGPGKPRLAMPGGPAPGGLFPLHRLANIYCPSGACRDLDSWPMTYPQEGWWQLDQAFETTVPVNLFAFSSRGVGVLLRADLPLHPGAQGLLLTPAHGAGVSRRPVQLCWHRPHPQDPDRQCAGLRFAGSDQP